MLYREIICCLFWDPPKKLIHALCGQNVEFRSRENNLDLKGCLWIGLREIILIIFEEEHCWQRQAVSSSGAVVPLIYAAHWPLKNINTCVRK
jgi:hypothetical protein